MLRDVGAAEMLVHRPPTTNLVVISPEGDVLQILLTWIFPTAP